MHYIPSPNRAWVCLTFDNLGYACPISSNSLLASCHLYLVYKLSLHMTRMRFYQSLFFKTSVTTTSPLCALTWRLDPGEVTEGWTRDEGGTSGPAADGHTCSLKYWSCSTNMSQLPLPRWIWMLEYEYYTRMLQQRSGRCRCLLSILQTTS